MGFAAIAITTSTLILLTTWGGSEYEWTSPTILSMAAVVIVGALLTVFIESRASQPLIPVQLFKNRNMVLTTLAGTVLGLAMMGVLGYMPTYLQMVHTLTPTEAGLMMIPMMVGMIGVSTGVGFIIAKTGNYKYYPIAGLAITAFALWWMSQMTVETSLTGIGVRFLVFGVGLGFVMQVLVLIVQNSFPVSQVGTATAANNFFRQIGSALGAAIAQQFQGADAANSLTPHAVAELPDVLRDAILNSYNDGLTPVIGMMVPLAIVAMLILFPLRQERLKETIE